MPRFQSAELISESVIKDLLNNKHFTVRLEKTFNRYPSHYNRKLFMKAMLLLKHRQMSFSEISLARVSFELYCSEHGGGMLASASVVLQALSMLGRVMSPQKLEVEIQKQQTVVDFPSLIYLYEFMDLVLKCALSRQVEEEMQSSESTEEDDPDFEKIFMTREERIRSFLDKQYQDSLYKKVDPPPASSEDEDHIILMRASRTHREKSTAGSQRQLCALVPALEHSQHQLFRARNGFTVFSKEQLEEAESLHASRECSRAGMRSHTNSRVGVRSEVASRVGLRSSRTGPRVYARLASFPGPGNGPVKDSTGQRSNANSETTGRMSSRAGTSMSETRSMAQLHESTTLPGNSTAPNQKQGPHTTKPLSVATEFSIPKSKSVPILPSLCMHTLDIDSSETEINLTESDVSKFHVACSSKLDKAKGITTANSTQGNLFRPLLVTKRDIWRQRGLIDELKWEGLRKKWKQLPSNIATAPNTRV